MEELEGRAPRLTSHPEIAACLWLLQTVFEVTPFTSLDRSSLGEPGASHKHPTGSNLPHYDRLPRLKNETSAAFQVEWPRGAAMASKPSASNSHVGLPPRSSSRTHLRPWTEAG